MNKKEFATRVSETLRENNLRKPVSIRKHTFHITDSEGNSADFDIRRRDKSVIYTYDDVINIIDACVAVIIDALKRGEDVTIRGFGSLGLKYRATRRTKEPGTEKWCEIEAHHVPKFDIGNDLKMAARLYDLALKEQGEEPATEDDE